MDKLLFHSDKCVHWKSLFLSVTYLIVHLDIVGITIVFLNTLPCFKFLLKCGGSSYLLISNIMRKIVLSQHPSLPEFHLLSEFFYFPLTKLQTFAFQLTRKEWDFFTMRGFLEGKFKLLRLRGSKRAKHLLEQPMPCVFSRHVIVTQKMDTNMEFKDEVNRLWLVLNIFFVHCYNYLKPHLSTQI